MVLGSYFSYSQFQETTLNFIKNKNPDMVFIFLRAFPLMPLNKPFFKYKMTDEIISWSVHPSLFNRKNFHWDEKFSKYEKEIDYNTRVRKKIELRDFNLLVGLLLGLNSWCVKFLMNRIKAIKNDSNSYNKKLFIISLPRNPESLMGNYICKKTNRKIRKRLSNELDFVDIYHIPKIFYEDDGIHFNTPGHEQIAKVLFQAIKREIDSGVVLS